MGRVRFAVALLAVPVLNLGPNVSTAGGVWGLGLGVITNDD